MEGRRKHALGMTRRDWLWIALITTLLCIVAFLILTDPEVLRWCLRILDMRNWTYWAWIGVVAAMVIALLVIRFWPAARAGKQAGK